jgi:hypothetical protein
MKTLIAIVVGLSFLLLTTGAYATEDGADFELKVLDKYEDAAGQDLPAARGEEAEMNGADETWEQIRPEVSGE